MADKMVVEDKVLAASLLPPVTLEKKNKQKAPLLPAVQLVSLWALLTVAVFFGCFFVVPLLIPGPPSWFPSGAELTDAKAAEVCAISQGVPWCIAAAAVTAALALLLPDRHCRRSRRVLACVALAATATMHLMLARVVTLAFLGNIFWCILATLDMSFLVAGDIICFLALLGRGVYANDTYLLLDLTLAS